MNTDEVGPGPLTLDITGLFKNLKVTSVVEATPDFLEVPSSHVTSLANKNRTPRSEFSIELYPLQLKTLIVSFQAQ